MQDDSVADKVLATVAAEYEVTEEAMMSVGRKEPIAEARQMAMYVLNRYYDAVLPDIGHIFGKTRATVFYAINKIAGLCEVDKTTRRHEQRIKDVLEISD